jgi:NitT/TauT family transport system substrate-binding protein
MLLRTAAALIALALFTSFAPAAGVAASDVPATVTIAYQPGLSYATLIVMKAQGTLEKQFPGTKFEWRVLSNGAAIRDGFLAGQIQLGAGGSTPFLVGWDRGVGYRLVAAMNEMNLWMMAKDPKITSIKDLTPSMKIGAPGPDSIQAIALRKGAQDMLGNAHALDSTIVAIQHPLGVVALLGGQLDAHFTSPPFQQEEAEKGAHVVYKSYDAFGPATFNSVYTTESFAKDHPLFIADVYKDIASTTKFIKTHPDETAQILSKDSEGKVSAEQFKKWITAPDLRWENVPHGFIKVAAFMKSIGLLTKVPTTMRELELPVLNGVGD